MNVLVGYTGFVGSNIYKNGNFDYVYNSKNIKDAFGTNPDLLVYSGLRAEKYLANNFPDKDFELILDAENNIKSINPKKLVLISTVDVLKFPNGMDETCEIDTKDLHAYGYNRYKLEVWAREKYPDCLIIRLPALYGINLKKNFIYDYINIIPFMLKKDKMEELSEKDNELIKFYELQENGFYKLKDINNNQKEVLKKKFINLDFSALNFTDSRNVYQFYPLKRLWKDIQIALKNDIKLFHPATEPISVSELYSYLSGGKKFLNECSKYPVNYNFKTIYADIFGGKNGYICFKNEILEDIKNFVEN